MRTTSRGTLHAVRFDEGGSHRVVSSITVGISPEGLALSPDGSLAVTTDMRRTYLPPFFAQWWPGTRRSGLSLVHVGTDGTPHLLDEVATPAMGVLPEHAVFDRTGSSIAAGVHHLWEDRPTQGAVRFWRFEGDGDTRRLVLTETSVPVVRGAHNLSVIW
jgi:hypothetical protein